MEQSLIKIIIDIERWHTPWWARWPIINWHDMHEKLQAYTPVPANDALLILFDIVDYLTIII